MFHDLNVPYNENKVELQRTLTFLAELNYNLVALSHTITGKLPGDITCAIPNPLPIPIPPKLRILRRCTLHLTDSSQNYRLNVLASTYDILALRPSGANAEKALQLAVNSTEVDLLSLDCSQRFLFHWRPAHLAVALQRGLKIELCYAAGLSLADGGIARRNLISNATAIIRATRGRGIVISSEARRALECRAPFDVINLAAVWGLGNERGHEAVGREARAVVVAAEMKRRCFKGAVDVVYGGEGGRGSGKALEDGAGTTRQSQKGENGQKANGQKPTESTESTKSLPQVNGKRAASGSLSVADEAGSEVVEATEAPLSNSQRKRRAKRARLEAAEGNTNSLEMTESVAASQSAKP